MSATSPADISSFDHLNVTVSKVRIFRASQGQNAGNASNSSNSSSGFKSFNVSETVDLTELQGEDATSVLKEDIDAGNYTKMELEASGIEATVNGSSVDVKIPSGKLQLTKGFTVAPNRTTEFVFDIKVVQRGNKGYILRPVISQSGVVGKDVQIKRKPKNAGKQGMNGSKGGGNQSQGNHSKGKQPPKNASEQGKAPA
ncbi:MAG: DUF4382 domain-containing protein [Candidatus Nanohalobium sp.]